MTLKGTSLLGVIGVSVAAGPGTWRDFLDIVGARAGTDGGSLVGIPFAVRFGVGAAVAVVAGLIAARAAARGSSALRGEILLVVALTVANPTLWATAFSLLIAIVPLWRSSAAHGPGVREAPVIAG